MDNSKLISLLRTFSTKEIREFKDYVASPFFNKNQELVLFYEQLRKLAPKFPLKKIKREVIYQTVFPKQPYDEKHLNYLMSFLLKLAEQYIGYQQYSQQNILKNQHILQSCIERDLEKHYQNIYNKAQAALEKLPYRDHDFYFQQYLLAAIGNRHFKKKRIRKFDPHLQETADYFDWYYLSNKLKLSCEMLDRQKFLSANYQQSLMEEIDQFLTLHPIDNIPPIAIYYCIFQMLTKEDGSPYFNQLKGLLDQHFHHFQKEEMMEMYLYAINFCIRKIREKKEHYVEETLNLYLKTIEDGLLFENSLLSPWTYKNVVKLGLRLQRFDWTETFILKYNPYIKEDFRSNSLHLNLADLFYYKKDYDQALSNLNKVALSDVFYTLQAKVMLLKIYYETKEEEALYSLIASFRIFLKRNKLISNNVRKTYHNFNHLLHQLLKENKLEETRQLIINTQLLTDRQWLLDVCQQRMLAANLSD
ncbi:MAG: hypothetical protein AAF985_06820 [Bacteroidota bacterium]